VQRLSVPLAIPAKPVETYLSLFHNAYFTLERLLLNSILWFV
jgi:hypothetical protein